jgi:hypothetical protein
MDSLNESGLTRLRAIFAATRLEKSSLAIEIASPVTSSARRQCALHPYSVLVNELRMTADEFEKLIAAAKRNEAKRTPFLNRAGIPTGRPKAGRLPEEQEPTQAF